MKKEISICGSDCSKCYCFESKMCTGCNNCKGIVFYNGGKECSIYNCCVTKHGFKSCLECDKNTCDILMKTRDPKYTDEEFEKNISDRIAMLKEQIVSNK